MSHMRSMLIRCAAAVVLLAQLTLSNDTFVHESAGNLMFVQNDKVAIQQERLIIGPPAQSKDGNLRTIPIHVEYELENTVSSTVEAKIGFPLAPCLLSDYLMEKSTDFVSGSARSCVKEPAMTLSVDGHPIAGKWGFTFLRDGRGLGDGPADLDFGRRVSNLINRVGDPEKKFFKDDPAFARAAKEICSELGGQMKDTECSTFKRIAVHRTFLWEYRFLPHERSQVIHDYQVTASWNVHPEDVFNSDAFCLSDSSTQFAWKKYRDDLDNREKAYLHTTNPDGSSFPYPREFFTEYVLQTGALWAGPIADFDLTIRKSAESQLISTCFRGLTKSSPLTFTGHRSNFKPSEILRVLYLDPFK